MTGLRLLMLAPAPVIRTDDGFILDAKFLDGMQQDLKNWPGELDCILREGAKGIPFGAREVSKELDFGLHVLGPDEPLTEEHFQGYDVVYCSADDQHNLNIPNLIRPGGPKIVYTLEYTLETRLQVAALDRSKSLARRLYSKVWLVWQELRRRKALKGCDGLHANGYPAFDTYKGLVNERLLYLDNRMSSEMFATKQEMADRAERVLSDTPLQLVYSGRLEPMKGAQDLVPIAAHLRELGTSFELNIFGSGSLAGQISAEIGAKGLAGCVHLHAPVDFETKLVPYVRAKADIFLCCHRQSDPSCSYLENMGCGLAVVGYANRMWGALCDISDGGWKAPLGDRRAIAEVIADISMQRAEIVTRSAKAYEFALGHDFVSVVRCRMDHLVEVVSDEKLR